MDIEQLVDKEVQWLAKQEAATVSKLLDIYQEAFKELQTKLADMPEQATYSRNHIKAIQAQLDVILSEMEAKQVDALSGTAIGVYRDEVLREHGRWEKLEELFGDPDVARQFSMFKPIIPQGSIKALLLTHNVVIKNFSDDLTNSVRRSVAKGMIAGEGIPKIVKRLSTLDTGANRARLHLIARMETARASNEAKQETIEQMNKEFPELDLWQMIKDRVDRTAKTRNHWFSWAISGTVRNVTKNEYFEVHTASMAAVKQEYAVITKRKTYDHGILWEKYSLGRRGKRIPAHYNDRAVVLPWRPSWDQSHFGTAKHPQGGLPHASQHTDKIPDEEQLIQKPKGETGSLRSLDAKDVRGVLQDKGNEIKQLKDVFEIEDNAQKTHLIQLRKRLNKFDPKAVKQYNDLVDKRNALIKAHTKEVEQLSKESRNKIMAARPGTIKLTFLNAMNERLIKKIERGAREFSRLIGDKMTRQNINFAHLPERAGYSTRLNTIALPASVDLHTIIHEMGHWFEVKSPNVLRKATEFLDNRTKGDSFERLIDIYPRSKYAATEFTRRDKFADAYTGKSYYQTSAGERSKPLSAQDKVTATEIISMGLEQMYHSPALFAVEDPEYFDFIWRLIKD